MLLYILLIMNKITWIGASVYVYLCYRRVCQTLEFCRGKFLAIDYKLTTIVDCTVKTKNNLMMQSKNCIYLPDNFVSLPFYKQKRILLAFPVLDGISFRPSTSRVDRKYSMPTTNSM
jgi:hypothetical protein